MIVVALNAGGSSRIVSCYEVDAPAPLDPPDPLWHHEIERPGSSFEDVIVLAPDVEPAIVVHRVVHPGLDVSIPESAFLDDKIRRAILDGRRFAPGHNGLALEGIDVARKYYPNAQQCVAFDRALGSDAPPAATTLPGPEQWRSLALRRFGFHGISHRDVIQRVARGLGRVDARVATIHLGSGCSISAFMGARLVENTMGLTPLEGIVMGARGGSLDPGLLLYLLKDGHNTLAELEDTLYHDSGLKGLSGRSLDTRDVYAAADEGDADARLALDVYCYRLRQGIGAIAATLGGLDAISWSGPVGEHSPRIRETVCESLGFLGIGIDRPKNTSLPTEGAVPFTEISSEGAGVRSFVVPTLEEWAMCRQAVSLATLHRSEELNSADCESAPTRGARPARGPG